MKSILLSLLAITMVGCSSTPVNKYKIQRDEITVKIMIVDKIPEDKRAWAVAICDTETCTLKVRRDKYPQCITHEVRHAFEGNWHEGRQTLEGCNLEKEM